MFVGSLVERHAQALASHLVALLDHLVLLAHNSNDTAIQVHQREVNARQGVKQSDLFLHVEVGSLSFEQLVRSDFDDYHHVAWLHIGHAVTFSVDGELLSVGGPLIDFDAQLLTVALDLLALAYFAPLLHVYNFALAIAVFARPGALRVHAWAHLSHHSLHASSFAAGTRLYSICVGSTNSIASRANPLSVYLDLHGLSVVDVSQRNFDVLGDWLDAHLSFIWLPTAATHEHAEDVVHSSTAASVLDSLLAVLVVDLSFVLVRQDVVRILDFLELTKIQ